MKKKISFKLFFAVLWRGVCQVFEFIAKIFGYKDQSTYAKVVWRIFAGCITSLVALFTGVILYAFATEVVYDDWIRPHTNDEYVFEEKHISNHIVFQDLYGPTGRIYDELQKKVLLTEVDWVVTSEDKDSLAVFSKEGKRGYVNRFTGEVAVPLSFTRAWVFSEGLAAVEKDNKLVFIDHSGNVVIDKDFDVHFNQPSYAFKNGYCVIQDAVSGKEGLIDMKGEWVLNPEYDNIYNNNGFWHVEKERRYGLFDAKLNEMFAVTNTAIWFHEPGIIEVRAGDNTAQRYDYAGNVLVDFIIDDIENLQYETTDLRNDITSSEDYSEDNKVYAVANCQRYRVNAGYGYSDHYGLIDRNGKRITAPLYTGIEAIAENLYLCQPDGIIINGQGKVIK